MSRPNLPTEISTRLKRFLRWLSEPEDWIDVSFENSWVNHGAVWEHARYYKDPYGVVHIQGLVKSGTLNTTVFTLPEGYRPSGHLIFATDESLSTHVRLNVLSSGEVNTTSGSSNTYLSISCSFRVA